MKNDTAAAIRNALTNILKRHSMDGITVKWICLEAGVSKQTFYNHYYGVGEVLEAICRDICAEAAGEGKAGEDGGTICRKILGAVCRHRDVLIHLYRSGRREEVGAMLRRECAALLIPAMEACMEPDAGEREERRYFEEFCLDTFMRILSQYAEEGFPEDVGRMGEICDRMIWRSLEESRGASGEVDQSGKV